MAGQPLNTAALDKLIAGYTTLGAIDFTPLMEEWGTIMQEDNREARLAGQDGWGIPLDAVTYRPADPPQKNVDHTILANNNLTNSWYRELEGPPMAPRGIESRVITNFVTGHPPPAGGQWQAIGMWKDVVSITGYPFLSAHFFGEGYLPIRNLAHVRPTAVARARDALMAFVRRIIGKP